jgi:hypothetical protein
MDDGNVGGAVVWRIAEGEIGNWRVGWNWEGYHLGTGKEVKRFPLAWSVYGKSDHPMEPPG